MSNKSGVSEQVISLPKGGGALKGIGEKFSPDLFTGTGNFTVPIDLPAGRNDFGPELSLTYSTGNGNSAFGQGWQLSVPGVSRKTSDGIPEYDAKDVFLLSGAEDLVPVERKVEDEGGERWTRTKYKPRTEGLFARIIRHQSVEDDYWTVHSKDGLVSTYGNDTSESRGSDDATIADPANADPTKRQKVFAWRLSSTKDPFENKIVYKYDRDRGKTNERHWDQTYLERIQYVDIEPGTDGKNRYLVSVEFDYEERPDPFSDYSPGFEVRTRKRCNEITIKTHTTKKGSYDAEGQQIRGYELIYQDERTDQKTPLNGISLLSKVVVTGYKTENGAEETQNLPPLEFGYSEFDPTGRNFDPVKGDIPTRSLANPDLELADIDANGLPDIIEMNGTVRYWRNLGNGEFDEPRMMREAPSQAQLADPGVQMIDFNGDARIDLMISGNRNNGPAGYYSLRPDGGWDGDSFHRFKQIPSFSLEDPEVEPTDLTGNGSTDVIRSGSRMEHFFSDREEGWNKVRPVSRQRAEAFPDVFFSDQRVRLAGVSGGGLQDIVLVHDGKIEYWPNLGHGDWGRRIHMRNSPRFPYGYDPRRILLGDVNGDGCADLVYVDDNRVLLWINKSGNAWSDRIEIDGTPSVTDMDAVRLVDLKGGGIQGVLWSADARGSRDNMFFLDFTDGANPYVLNEMDNQMGAVTRVKYEPSTRFYLADQQDRETRWRTTLPFPVQVVSQVETIDQVSENKLTTVYRYHHGHWDGKEREFRGFGFVEQQDTTTFSRYNEQGLFDKEDFEQVEDDEQFSPPTLTKTWFHQGPIEDAERGWREVDYSGEYWSEDAPALSRSEETSQLLASLRRQGQYGGFRDALRTLRGRVLRTELYAIDGDGREDRPYTVTESSYGIRKEEDEELLLNRNSESRPKQKSKLIFFPYSDAHRTTQWERGADPMTQFTFTGAYDDYGQPQANVSIAVPRGHDFRSKLPSNTSKLYLGTYGVTEYAQDETAYILDRTARSTVYELPKGRGNTPVELGNRLRREIEEGLQSGTLPGGDLIGQTVNFYDGHEFSGTDFKKLGGGPSGKTYGALTRTETLVLTDDLIEQAYPMVEAGGDPVLSFEDLPFFPETGANTNMNSYPKEFQTKYSETSDLSRPDLTATPLGYGYSDGTGNPYVEGYYTATERRQYDFQTTSSSPDRGLVRVTRDPLGNETRIEYDDEFYLLPVSVEGPTDLRTEAEYDFRVMQPMKMTDPNGNQTAMRYTPLGLPDRIAVMGKKEEEEGDTIDQPGTMFRYDFSAFEQSASGTAEPISVHTIKREQHRWDLLKEDPDARFLEDEIERHPERFIQMREYSDGFGRLIQTRAQAEDVVYGDERFGNLLLNVVILVTKDGSLSPREEKDLQNHSVGISTDLVALSDSEVRRFCEDRFESGNVELKSYPNESTLIQALQDGEVDSIALDSETASAHPAVNSPIERAFTINVDRVEGKNVTAVAPQVTVSGWQTYDNKGQVVEKYEPFFDTKWDYLSRSEASDDPRLFGQSVRMFYDPRGRVVRTVNPDGSEQRVYQGKIDRSTIEEPEKYEPSPWGAYTYDANDNGRRTAAVVERNPHLRPPTEYEHHWNTPASIEVDALGRTVLAVERNRKEGSTAVGDIEKHETRSEYDIRGNVTLVEDALERDAFEYKYDLANTALRTESIDAGVRAVVFDAAGNEVERHDSKGARTLRVYDELNRPSRMWARDKKSEAGGSAQDLTQRERLMYGDSTDSKFRDNNDRFTQAALNRNLLGQLYAYHDEAGKLSFTEYDFKGNLLEEDRRVVTDQVLLSGEPVEWEPKRGTVADREREVIESSDKAYETSFEYDALNRQTKLTYPKDVKRERKSLVPSYNRAGALRRVSIDKRGSEDLFMDHIAYNARGQRSMVAYGNGVMTRHSYDQEQFRLARMRTETYEPENGGYRTTGERPGSGDLYQNFTYEYDLVGNVSSILDQTPNCGVLNTLRGGRDELQRKFEYDPLYRLVYADGRECTALLSDRPMTNYTPSCGYSGPGLPAVDRQNAPQQTSLYWEQYKYDEAGNMLEMRHAAQIQDRNTPNHQWARNFGIENGSNNLIYAGGSSEGPQNHTYDRSGNLLTQGTGKQMTLKWDHADHLQHYFDSEIDPSKEAFYCYDFSGQRVKKVIRKNGDPENKHTEVTVYVDGIFEHHYMSQNTKENNTLHVMDDEKRIATIRVGDSLNSRDKSPDEQYHYSDHLGSGNIVISGEGEWFNSEEYSPYGETTFGGFAKKRFRFSGKERDEESGFYYHGARYFAPWIGRWVSCDPAGMVDDINLYLYVKNNPLRYTDPTGKETSSEFIDIGADPELQAVAKEVNASNLDLSDNRSHAQPRSQQVTKKQARAEANAGAANYRQTTGMIDPNVQAGHTAAARHAPESNIKPSDMNDPNTFQQLHSRRGQGLDVTVSDPSGTRTTTRHRSQEGLNDAAVERVKGANGGKLTPQGQLDAAAEVRWRTENTPMDQRNVDAVRNSGSAKPDATPPIDTKTGKSTAKKAAKFAGEKVLKILPLVGALYTLFGPGEANAGERVARAIAGEIGIGPVDLETIYDIATSEIGQDIYKSHMDKAAREAADLQKGLYIPRGPKY